MKIFIIVLFALTYIAIIALPKYKTYITGVSALASCVALIISESVTVLQILESIDYNVLFMLVGIMITVGLFSESNMPSKLSESLVSKTPNVLVAVVVMVILSGVISAFIDNVATVLMLAPIGLAVAKKTGISPIPVIISIAVSSNLQGAATLVGDTTSIMLGSFANMSFFDFFFIDGKLSIFWAVEFGAVLTIPVLLFIFRKHNSPLCYTAEKIQVTTIFPTVLLSLNLILLIAFSFIKDKLALTNGIICISIGIIALVFDVCKFKNNPVKSIGKHVDCQTVLFLTFLFVLIKSVTVVGIIDDIANMFISVGNKNVFLLYTIIVFGSVLFSAFIDNIPYVATMLPVVSGLCAGLPGVSPYLLYFGLLCGATLGGNITPIGASANVVGIGILNKEGYKVSLKDFLKIGLPFTFVAVMGGYVLCWLVFGI